MIFEFYPRADLPRLAWFLRMRSGTGVVRVEHGPWVETNEKFFCEGAWDDASFMEAAFAEATAFVGSGGRIRGDALVLAAATNTIEPLKVMRVGDEVLASNSLAFLLERAGEQLDAAYKRYEWDICSIINGLDKYRAWFPTKAGQRVYLYYYCNVVVDRLISISLKAKTDVGSLHSFSDYRSLLSRAVRNICANAQDSTRRVRYKPITTISSGYDSPAAAVLAKENGCTEALTFLAPRPHFGADDRGTEIAARLGMEVREFDRLSYMGRADLPEAEFIACGYGGDDVIFAAFEPLLARHLLFTGFHGDKMWERTNPKVSRNIVRGDPSGGSMQEFRLRVGFLHLAIPFIGCVRHPDVHAISNSDEMKPWRTDVAEYDRPIPRRIVETASVPRSSFGQAKRAAAVTFPPMVEDGDIRELMSPSTIADYYAFSSSVRVYSGLGERARVEMMHLLYKANLRIVWRLRKWFGMHVKDDLLVPRYHSRRPNRNFFTLHWAIDKIADRYRVRREPHLPGSDCVEAFHKMNENSTSPS